MKKKITAALLCAAMVLSLSGCAENEKFNSFFEGINENNSSESTPTASKPNESKPNESKPNESKPNESKPNESKPNESKPEESKPEESSSTESKPEEKPQPVDPIDWSTVPYADELDFLYEDVEGGIRITEYRGDETVIKIPETINGKTVVELEDSFTVFQRGVTGISIPNSVKRIPKCTIFYNSLDLKSVVLPDNDSVHSDRSFLQGYNEKDTVFTYRGKTYQMPEDYIKFYDALYPGTGNMSIKDGTLYRVSITIKDVVIPDNITSIKGGAFSNCDLIEDITIPGGVTEIKIPRNSVAIFYGCPNLKSVTFAEGVTKIDGKLFEVCPKLETIAFPDSLIHLDEGCFGGNPPKYLQVTYKGVTYKSNQLQDLYKAVNG